MVTKENKVAIVTGAASGIGKKIASELIEQGMIVYGIDVSTCKMKGLKFCQMDVSCVEDVKDFVDSVYKDNNGIDYVINAAGIISVQKCYRLVDVPMREWNRVMDVNLKGAFILAQNCLEKMNEGGCIINFSTEQVAKPNFKSVPYAISKAGIEMLNKVLALEGKSRGVRANVLALGSVNSNFIRHMVKNDQVFREKIENADKNMAFGIITVEDVWDAVRFLLFDAYKMSGQTMLIDSGMTITD